MIVHLSYVCPFKHSNVVYIFRLHSLPSDIRTETISLLFGKLIVLLIGREKCFVVFYSGDRGRSKIFKISDAFGASRYPFTEDLGKQFQMITEVCIFFLQDVLCKF